MFICTAPDGRRDEVIIVLGKSLAICGQEWSGERTENAAQMLKPTLAAVNGLSRALFVRTHHRALWPAPVGTVRLEAGPS